ncbi:regulatory protein ArsR [Beutenbergia cavernae DSM 12333]|uniref:Regulatory protein ArsR n=1 Tax=Beutenbergia cavernae (strain ATCC BAA-8 / DSM 12333 / CCUG 43141 / JCM 11478 / NBRC 16432 / NCIMB 13614 / HKI 0122) TaxID=471853 RepID=C5C4I5_BEUC1|nr:metalloregulator ArsR/SmtB family transcription factor [Beutenbergia cavernae]ACQ82109.1 regulatory protein ArsR [Beutenbergia cavernae DSM 12333]
MPERVGRATSSAVLDPVPLCAALSEPMRWQILEVLGSRDASASDLARELPISRQAIAKHLAQLEAVGLVEPVPDGRAIRYRALGARLGMLADRLEAVGRGWDRRLARLADVAERLDAE